MDFSRPRFEGIQAILRAVNRTVFANNALTTMRVARGQIAVRGNVLPAAALAIEGMAERGAARVGIDFDQTPSGRRFGFGLSNQV